MNANPGSGRHWQRPGSPPPLPASRWQRVRRTVTVGVFLAATVIGVGVGLQGAQVSPVAPPAAVVSADGAAPIAAAGPGSDDGIAPRSDRLARHGRRR
jgi:hypothetical protein